MQETLVPHHFTSDLKPKMMKDNFMKLYVAVEISEPSDKVRNRFYNMQLKSTSTVALYCFS